MMPIYLDYNATTPIGREVADAMAPYLYEHFGNPSSSHPYGVTARRAVAAARAQIAALLNCRSASRTGLSYPARRNASTGSIPSAIIAAITPCCSLNPRPIYATSYIHAHYHYTPICNFLP